MGKKKIIIAGVGCVILLLCCSATAVGGYFGYNEWYLPKVTKEYVDTTEDDFESTKEIVSKFEENIKENFTTSSSSSSTSDSLEDTKEDINDGYEMAQELQTEAQKALDAMPSKPQTINSVDKQLEEYYESAKKFGEEYEELMQFYVDAVPILEDYYDTLQTYKTVRPTSMDDYDKAADQIRAANKDLIKIKKKFAQLDASKENKPIRKLLVAICDDLVKAMNTLANAYDSLDTAVKTHSYAHITKARNQLNKATSNFSSSIDDFTKEGNKYNRQMRDKYLKKVSDLEEKEKDISAEFTSVKDKYDLEEGR